MTCKPRHFTSSKQTTMKHFNRSLPTAFAQLWLIVLCVLLLQPTQAKRPTTTYRVMQFNILQSKAEPQGHEWDTRKEAVANMLQDIHPDLVAVQEARKTQCRFLQERFPQYVQIKHPKDGIEANGGQRNLILYDASKFELLGWEKFWFSTTPQVSSLSWDAMTPKLTICAHFRCKSKGHKTFWLACTHYFPIGDTCRTHCVRMMLEKTDQIAKKKEPIFVCGDLNMNPDDARLAPMWTRFSNAAEIARQTDGRDRHTYNGFRPDRHFTIDYIFCRNVSVDTYRVVDSDRYGVPYISDHYPVFADICL